MALLITLLQFTVGTVPWALYFDFLGGTVLLILGLTLFLLGVNVGLVDAGEAIGSSVASLGRLSLVIILGFVVGFAVTVPEPDVQVLALQVRGVTQGAIDGQLLVLLIALGVGLFTALGLLRIFLNVPIYVFILVGYTVALLLMIFSPPEYSAIAFDGGGVTTGSLTVPFILALGVGVAAVAARRGGENNSFGILGLASLGPVLTVLILGVLSR